MRLGFTGTRNGMREAQADALLDWLSGVVQQAREFHHGDCVGADDQAAGQVDNLNACGEGMEGLGCYYVETHSHPGLIPEMRADHPASIVHPPKPMLRRNQDIVDSCDVLLAAPDGPEKLRSGTWSTVRYARKQGKRVVIFMPDGKIADFGAA